MIRLQRIKDYRKDKVVISAPKGFDTNFIPLSRGCVKIKVRIETDKKFP
jgi:hypothetical protein